MTDAWDLRVLSGLMVTQVEWHAIYTCNKQGKAVMMRNEIVYHHKKI